MKESYRCFVAAHLPAGLREAVADGLAGEGARVPGVRWTDAARLHFTLKFLGDVEPAAVPPAAAALDAALGPFPPCAVELRGAGAFPSADRARVVWVGVGEGAAGLAALAAAVEDCLAPLGFAREGRPFVAHLTVGRLREPPRDRGSLPRLLAGLEGRRWGGFVLPAVHLMRSTLFPSGPSYSILHETSLCGASRGA